MKYPLRFVASYVQLVTQHYESRIVRKAPLQSTHTERNGGTCHSYINYDLKSEVSIMVFLSAMFNPFHSSTNQEMFEKHPAIKIATMENMDDFRFEGMPSRATAKLTLFAVSKDEWDTKEDTGKSMKNTLYVLRYARRYLSG